MLKDWIIGIGGSDADDVIVYKFTGTIDDAKQKLVDLVREERDGIDLDDWDFGTESVGDVSVSPRGKLYAFGCYRDFHTDYSATPLDMVMMI